MAIIYFFNIFVLKQQTILYRTYKNILKFIFSDRVDTYCMESHIAFKLVFHNELSKEYTLISCL